MILHVLHVKNGHCTIVDHGSRKTLIDIHKLAESEMAEEQGGLFEKVVKSSPGGYVHKASDPVAYWEKFFGTTLAFRTIITHPDKDHIKGFNELCDTIGTVNLWMPTRHIDTIPDSDDGNRIRAIVDGKEEGVTFIEPKRGSDNRYFGTGDSDWDQIEILHPANSHQSESSNQGSYLIKIHYGVSSVIIGGDAEQETFKWLLDKYPDDLKCTVFVASHHGRQSGWPGKDVMEQMNPLMVLIPKGKIESKDSALGNYQRVIGAERYLTTSYAGNIRVTLNKQDDINLFECERSTVNKELNEMLKKARKLRIQNV
ncbi:hypothetical protein ATW55_14890 [Ferroacidibacillus organovorans]|uniref:Metallo-beta-lactamase domain-containing protein n=1 Tax=Ferroacidibacillus organovorans TaxID=1765683 RepID=A0A101XQU5_9BACL|nr:hypothetical protein [Ferroacidibacillus organovorans]KUO95852.1 hypothetical protein ATW55_14890 [Ferroacidibacillus organovorans]